MSGPLPPIGRLAGVDYGHVRIGIALSDPGRSFASPHENYTRRGNQADAEYFRRLAEQQQIAGFVVGLPVHASGNESQKSKEARAFGDWLAETTGLPVDYYDERYSTVEAEALLGGAKLTKKKRQARLDMLAAQIILSSYLQSHAPSQPPLDLED